MIRAVTVTNFKNEILRMELSHPEKSGMLIYDITGIGGTKADINATDISTGDGVWFNSARVGSRNIVLSIKLMGPDVESTRHKCHRYFPIKKPVTLTFETDSRTTEIEGYVESNEPLVFSSQEYTQISIICPDPYFRDAHATATAFSGVTPEFYFPFSNESATEPKLYFGSIRVDDRAIIDYKGDADTGVLMTLHALGPVDNITIYNVDTKEKMAIDTFKLASNFGGGFDKGDDIIISTVPGQKYVHLLRHGVYTNIISVISRDADWFRLTPGDNVFAFTAESGISNAVLTFTYRNAYGGI